MSMTLQTRIFSKTRLSKLNDSLAKQIKAFSEDRRGKLEGSNWMQKFKYSIAIDSVAHEKHSTGLWIA